MISRLTESINQAYDGASPSDEIIAGAEKALIDVSENANRSGFKNIRDILNINFGSLEARSLQTSDITEYCDRLSRFGPYDDGAT